MKITDNLLLLGAFAFFSLATANNAHAQSAKLRVAYTAFAGTFTVLWVGKDAGLYQKSGADMELLYIGSSTKAVQALIGGDIDIMYSAAGAVVDANLAGAELTMIGCQYDKGQTSFFTTAPLSSIGDLKGKAVGVTRFGAFSDFVARHVLKKHRLQPIKDVALLQLGGTQEIIAGMQNNLVQGGSISLPLSINARKLGFRELLTNRSHRPGFRLRLLDRQELAVENQTRRTEKGSARYHRCIRSGNRRSGIRQTYHRQIHSHHRCRHLGRNLQRERQRLCVKNSLCLTRGAEFDIGISR